MLAAGGSLSLFAGKQILELRTPTGKPGKEGSSALQQPLEQARGNDNPFDPLRDERYSTSKLLQ